MSIYSKDRWFVISQKHTVCTLCPNDGAILWYVLLSYKKTLQNKCVCIYCFSLPKLTWQFCSGRRGHENHTLVNVQTEGAFTNYIYELIWQEREALVLYSPFFSNVGHYRILQCVMVIEAQHWFRAGARLHYSGSISCIETMKHET